MTTLRQRITRLRHAHALDRPAAAQAGAEPMADVTVRAEGGNNGNDHAATWFDRHVAQLAARRKIRARPIGSPQ